MDSKSFPTDPLEVIRINDAHRRPDVGDADLWTADQLASLPPQAYAYAIPTFAPRTWPTPRRLSQEGYDAEFRRRCPLIARLLPRLNPEGEAPKVIVAGGAAAAPYYEHTVAAGDVDLFVVGIDPDNKDALWATAHQVVREIREITQEEDAAELFGSGLEMTEMAQLLAPGILTLSLQLRSGRGGYRFRQSETRKYQVILRAYPSPSAVVHAFDVPSCCTFYDGRTACSTTLGAYAHRFRINLVHPGYRSTTYESRLAKYFKRHYALGLVHLKTGSLKTNEELVLPHLALTPAVIRGNRATGTVRCVGDQAESDYEASGVRPNTWWWDGDAMSRYAAANMNLAQLASGENRFVMLRCTDGSVRRRRHGGANPEEYEWLPMEDWYKGDDDDESDEKHEPTFAEILPRDIFNRAIDSVVKGAFDANQRIRAANLTKYLGMTSAEVAHFVEQLLKAIAQNPGRRVSTEGALAHFKERLIARYEAVAAAPIPWWITADPGRQYTASLNPRMEDPAEWYGAEHVEPNPGNVSRDVYVESLLAALESKDVAAAAEEDAPVYDGNCALCLTALDRGAANSITLPCGHVFHWAQTPDSECEGIFRWTQGDHNDCPVCRATFGEGDDEAAGAAAAIGGPIALLVDWLALGAPGLPPGGEDDL